MTKEIIFIRHAESIANAGKPTQDPENIPLSANGLTQAALLPEQIQIIPQLIINSSYIRTQQTAEPLIKKYPSVPVEIWDVHEFTYIDKSRCINTTTKQREPFVDEYWEKNSPYYNDGGNAESFAKFLDRITTCKKMIGKRPDNSIVVFTHEQFIRGFKMLFVEERDISSNLKLERFMKDFRKRKYNDSIENACCLNFSELF